LNALMNLKTACRNNQDEIQTQAPLVCPFMFQYYTDIYNKVRKDEIDLEILLKFISILRQIEDGDIDQHEGAFAVGTLLKEMYVDSALKKADKLNAKTINDVVKPIDITYREFKKSNLQKRA